MDKEERKDGKEKQWENENTNKNVKKRLHASCFLNWTNDSSYKKIPASRIGLNTFLYVNALATESWPHNHRSSLTHSLLNNT